MIERPSVRFALAALAVMVAALCRLALMTAVDLDTPFLTYYPAVMFASVAGGFGPGLLATGLAIAGASFLTPIDPDHTWAPPSTVTLVAFAAAGALVAWMGGRARQIALDREDALSRARSAERDAQAVLGSIGDAFISVNSDWRIRYANDAALRFVNMVGSDLIGRHWDTSWPLLGDEARASCRRAMTDRAVLQVEDFNDTLDRTLDVRAFPTADGGLSLYVADISATRRQHRAVSDTERQVRLALRAARLGTWHADIASGTVVCSPEALSVLGLEDGDRMAERLRALVHPDDVEAVAAAKRRAIDDGTECTVEFRIRRPDGSVAWLEARGQAVDTSGRRLAGVILDATARRSAEQQRIAMAAHAGSPPGPADAPATPAASPPPASPTGLPSPLPEPGRDEFLSLLAHELRTPLNAIMGWCQVARLNAADPAQVAAAADVIARNARAQAAIITDLADAHDVLHDRVTLERDVLDVAEVTKDAAADFEPQASAKDVKFRAVWPTAPVTVSADVSRLRQALAHALDHTLAVTAAGATISVTVGASGPLAEVRISNRPEGATASDAGAPAPGATPPRRPARLGMGLSIAQRILRQHGGDLILTLAGVGQGKTILLQLPLGVDAQRAVLAPPVPGPDDPPPVVDAPETRLEGLTLLVLEDDADTRAGITQLLEEAGATVVAVARGADALDVLVRRPVHVIVSDVSLPEMDGYEFIRRVRSLPVERGGTVAAIAVTAHAHADDRRRALLAGYQMHIVKPVKPVEFRTAVRALAMLARATGLGRG